MSTEFDPAAVARRLVAARKAGLAVPHADALPPDRAAAFAVQDRTLASLGAIGGWKVGAKGPDQEPACSPLPASGILSSGVKLIGPPWHLRGVEVEVAVRLGRDLTGLGDSCDKETLLAAIDTVVPAIEVVETRLAGWKESNPLAQLADLQSHGALVVGADSSIDASQIDLRTTQAYLAFDGQPVASTRGANPAADVWRLLGWLAVHCEKRGFPLRAGQVVTTGSCTGMLFAADGTFVQAQLAGIGSVDLQF